MEILQITLVCLLSVVVLAQAGIHRKLDDPEEFVCPPNASGAFAHETACDKYYLCNNGSATLFTCQDGLLFDLELKNCNFAEFVDCGDRTIPTTPPPTTPAPTVAPVTGDYECESPGGAFPHPTYCEKYFVCVDNEPTEYTCPDDQLFDLNYYGCNWAELVDCQDRIRPNGTATMIPTIAPSVTPDPGYECPSPGGAFEHPVYCELYYLCVEDVPSLEICPADQLFDTVWAGCNWENLVDCGDRIRPGTGAPGTGPTTTKPTTTTTPPGTGPTKPPPAEFECPEADGIFADPADCSAFYNCANYDHTRVVCQDPLLFNDEAKVCDFDFNVDCGDRPLP